ncbi:AraC family transcriptional regulator [Pedobacter psychrotolerans]|uniref:AraC family transcriptional regulator n=1 Tax=Pedobacter psychrotolerans TaxID=1843235 RepID=A0A4R2H6S2_9SPHI|nr:AraC family transcriptional regulator [Pedobacter psychrotolerans]TCO21512.1 AraC family transcriptional regulator [Pedobacter psychrotolerans]GGE39177.1 AraC family transcriptional regulator [Pedobacter psychrotolerans]
MLKKNLKNINCVEEVRDGYVLHQHFGQFSTDWHEHPHGQLVFAENGLLFLYTLNNRYLLPTKFCAWIPQNENHKLVSYSPDLLIRTIYLDISDKQDPFYKQIGIYQTSSLLDELIFYSRKWNENTIADETEQCFYRNFKNILPDICKEEIPLALPAPRSSKMVEIINFLTEHFLIKHSIAGIAKQFSISERTLSRLFQKELGMPMFQFLKILKLIKALEWFDDGISNVSEVVYRLGYESVSTFSNNFHEVLGFRPQTYLLKKKHRQA